MTTDCIILSCYITTVLEIVCNGPAQAMAGIDCHLYLLFSSLLYHKQSGISSPVQEQSCSEECSGMSQFYQIGWMECDGPT